MAVVTAQSDEVRMPARYYVQLCELLAEDGIDICSMLGSIGLSRERMEAVNAQITLNEFEKLVALAEKQANRTDLGFVLGKHINVSNHEILGYGMLTAPTFEHAMRLASRYYRLMTPLFSMQYKRGPVHTELIFQPNRLIGHQALRFLIETIAVSTHEVIKTLVQGALSRYEFRVSYQEPPHRKRYAELSPAVVTFEGEALPGVRLVLDTALMDRPMPMADRNAMRMAEARCEEMLRKTSSSVGVVGWVSMMLREAADGFPSLNELAMLCNKSPRTLERQLEREGCRFSQLAKSIRHEKACELLQQPSISITDIAYQLGYKELSSFTRAFIRESGMTPSDYRKAGQSSR